MVHHLAVDGVSWRIILEDLETAYGQAEQGEAVKLPQKTSSFQQWAKRLKAKAYELPEQEVKYWSSGSLVDMPAWPVDEPEGSNREQDAEQVTLSLSEEETQALLKEVPPVYRTQINEVLLTALAQAMQAWTGSARLLVHMEGHGREEIGGGLDVTRTVGWFTSL
ncbi:condensation domain-containing protein, partial [Paenibacillus sp. JCM 10914]|uniref:condensation domain-containing protein n=1 Tax=Paenibacillus sp. JCM 10914 TaxID=1236974 RepID=UPI001E488B75